jgi:hypothetical protein
MSRFLTFPIGELDYVGAVVFGNGLGCMFAVSFLQDWEKSAVVRLGFAICFVGALMRTVAWLRRKRLDRTAA